MEKIQIAIKIALEEWTKENGEDAVFEDGDEFPVVFNDAVLILSMEEGGYTTKFLLGTPVHIDYDLEL